MKSLFVEPLIPLCEAEALATSEELELVRTFAPERRHESLAWRALVRRELGADTRIAYNPAGAPILPDHDYYLGVSHGAGRIAVCISDTPCAVDIESAVRNFSRITSRYMTGSERALSSDPLLPAAVWCAKETLYKLSGRTELNLLGDLHIESADFRAGVLVGRILDEKPISLTLHRDEDYIAVFVL